MAGNNLGAAFSIDVSDLKAGLAQANRLIRESESEFQAAAAGMDDWTNSAEGLQKRVDSLNNQVDIQKEKVAALVAEKQNIIDKMTAEGKSNEEIERAVDGVNKSIEREGKQLDRLQGSLKRNQSALDKMQESTDDAADSTDDLGKEAKDTRTPLEKLNDTISDQEKALKDLKDEYANAVLQYGKNSKEAKGLSKQIDKLNDELEDNKKKLKDTEKSSKSASNGFEGIKKAAKIAVGAVAALTAAAGAVVGAFFGLADSTAETSTNMAKLKTAFESSGSSAEAAKDTYLELYGILGDEGQATEAAAHLAKLTTSEEELANWTKIATGIYAEFGDSLPIEGLTEAANETAKVGQVTGPLADALNWSTMSADEWSEALGGNEKALKAFQKAAKKGASAEDAFNEALAACSDEQERQQLITAALNGLYGESAEAYAKNNKEIIEANKAQAELNNTLASLGDKARPIMTNLKEGFNAVLQAVLGLLENVDWDAISAAIENAFAYFIDTILPAIVDGIQWIIDNKDALIAGIVGVGAAFVAWNVVSMIQGVVSAMKGMTLAQAALNLVMSLNPIGIVVAALAGLTAAFVVLWNKCDGFREFWIGLWDTIKTWCIDAWESISIFFTDTIPALIDSIGEWFSRLPEAIKTWFDQTLTNVKEWGASVWSDISTACTNAYNAVVEWFSKIPGAIQEWFNTALTNISEWGADAWSNISTTCTNIFNSIVEWFSKLPGEIWTWLSNAYTNVVTWGTNLLANIGETCTNIFNKVVEWFSKLPGEILTWITSAYENVTSWGSDLIANVTETCTNFFDTVVEWFSKLPGEVAKWFSEVIKNVASWASDMASNATQAATDFFNNVVDKVKTLPGEIWNWLSDAANNVVIWGGDLAAKGLEAATELWNSIVDKVKGIPGELLNAGKDIVEGLWNGISSKVGWLKSKIEGWCGGIIDTIKGWFGIASPSKLMRDEIGKNMALGVGVGFEKNLKGVSADMARALDNAVPSVGVNASGVSGALASGSNGGVTVNQTNYYAQAHSRYELYKSKQDTAAAVRLALGGAY